MEAVSCKRGQTLLKEITGTRSWRACPTWLVLPLALNRMRRPYVLRRVKKTIFSYWDCKIVSEDLNSSETRHLFLLLGLFPLFRADLGSPLTWFEKSINKVFFLCKVNYVNNRLFLYLTFKAINLLAGICKSLHFLGKSPNEFFLCITCRYNSSN